MKEYIEDLKNGKYNIEDMKFLNMRMLNVWKNDNGYFQIESELSIEDKIAIIDLYKDGVASYMLNIIKKWNDEKGSLPQDSWGNPKTVSKKAWIKKNDIKKIIDNEYSIGNYWLFGSEFKSLSLECPTTEHGYPMKHTGEHIAEQWFYDLCYEFRNKESKWYKEHDHKQIKITKVKELGNSYSTVFNCKLLNDIVWNKDKNVTNEQLDAFIKAYEALEKCITEQTEKLTNIIGNEFMYKQE